MESNTMNLPMNKTRSTRKARSEGRSRLSRPGFSLLELMLVLVILGLLSTVAAVALLPQAAKAKVRTTKASMNVIKNGVTQYQLEKNRAPASLVELVPNFIEEGGLKDGWKMEFYYSPTPNGARPFSLVSAGPDMTFETEDDIDVWTMDLDPEG